MDAAQPEESFAMKTARWIAACFALLALTAGPRAAAGADRPTPFSGIESSLAAVEGGLRQIETSGKITRQIDFDASLERYQEELRKSYEATTQAVQDEAKKAVAAHQPGTAAAKRLQAWEDALAGHRTRMEKVIKGLTAVNMKVRDGSILFAPDVLKEMPKEEVDELKQWLTPAAVRKYQALDKSLFAGPVARREPEQLLARELSPPAGCKACRPRSRSPLSLLDDLLAPDAEAAIALGCVSICGAQPEGCIPCLIVAGFGTDQLVKILDQDLKICANRHTRIGRALCKTAVVLGFIATIA
jgi:hypothetical protein